MSKIIVEEAISWLGTRFKHQGRVKKNNHDSGGCDCLGLVLGIAKSLNIKALNGKLLYLSDQKNYPKSLVSNILQQQFDELLPRVEIENIHSGDIILLKLNNWPQHLAIIATIEPNITIIYSYMQARKVVEQHLPNEWREKIVAAYSFS